MEFSKLNAPSLKEMFIQEMEGMILSGKLAVGEKLPPEREIAKVSTNREARGKAFDFHHEIEVLSGNILMPLIFYSFRDAVMMLWERYCILYGREKLYVNSDTLCKFRRR